MVIDATNPDLLTQMNGGLPPISSGGAGVDPTFTSNQIPQVDRSNEARDLIENNLITDNQGASPQRLDGFNQAIEQMFPMTPEMIRRMREIQGETERATLERPEPQAVVGSEILSLEPGTAPPSLNVTPGVASVISIYDVTGQAWPIEQYVLGDGRSFQVIQLGENSNSLTVTPLANVGWTNLVLRLEEEPTPVVVRVNISSERAHFRHDVQVLGHGPNSEVTTASGTGSESYNFVRPGDTTLTSILTGADIPDEAKPLAVSGVSASAYQIGDDLFIRSRHPLLSPTWTGAMTGPDGVRVYRIEPTGVALFSVDGRIIRADIEVN